MTTITNTKPNRPVYLSVAESAETIGVSQRTLRSWIADRKIKVARLGGRLIIRLIDLERFVDSHLEGGAE